MMMVVYIIFIKLLEEFGFLLFMLVFFFYLLSYFFSAFSFSGGYLPDLVGFSMSILTVVVFFLMILSGCFDYFKMNKWGEFLLMIMFFSVFLFAVFFSCNYFFFYLFFEMSVIPIFIMIIGWGYSVNRTQSAIYMFLYTFFSSLPFLIMLIYFNLSGVSLVFLLFFLHHAKPFFYSFIWLFFFLVFVVKLPIFFFHLWLPKAHVDAPLLGSMVLAGVLLKLGGYGVFKSMVFFYMDMFIFTDLFFSFSIMGGVLMGMVCMRQVDLKSLIAYSSVVHMGPVFACIFFMSFSGVLGGYLMMFSHGLCSSCLFFLLNLCYLSLSSRSFLMNRGGMFISPVISFFWFFFCVSNMGFPPTFNFFSELFIVLSVFSFSFMFFFFLFLIMMLSGFYSVMMYLYFNHGGKKIVPFLFFFSLKDLLVLWLSSMVLLGFIFFMQIFLC